MGTHLQRVALDAGNDRVGVRPVLGALIHLLDDNDLLACLTSAQDNRDLQEESASALPSR